MTFIQHARIEKEREGNYRLDAFVIFPNQPKDRGSDVRIAYNQEHRDFRDFFLPYKHKRERKKIDPGDMDDGNRESNEKFMAGSRTDAISSFPGRQETRVRRTSPSWARKCQ